MKEFTGKTLEEAKSAAAEALGVAEDKLIFTVLEEKKGLFSKKATIAIYDISDAAAYAEEYLKTVLGAMGIDATTESYIEDEIIHITLDSSRNPILIGKSGKTLQALNELDRLAVSDKFQKRYRILLDVGGYKEDKYGRLARLAKRTASQVLRSHVSVKLDPMTPDERRIIHNALSGMRDIKTESTGEGNERAVNIIFCGKARKFEKAEPIPEEDVEESVEQETIPTSEEAAGEAIEGAAEETMLEPNE